MRKLIRSRFALGLLGLALVVAAGFAAAAVSLSGSSRVSGHPYRQLTENGAVSPAFAQHTEDLFAAKVGDAGENPTSAADENYQLNGGDAVTAENVLGAQAAFGAIQKS